MSAFNKSSSYFKRNSNQQLNISSKVSQKELKKNKKLQKNTNSNSNVSDNEFDRLMEDNDESNTLTNNISNENQIKLSSYLDKISDSEIITQLIQEEIKGVELANRIKYENYITGSKLLNAILNKYKNPNNYNWVNKEEYGEALINLLEDNFEEQLLCLLVIQNYSTQIGLPKITSNDKDVYYIKLIFQLMFTKDIIDESIYWKWFELITNFTDISEDTKNKLCIQTSEFFNILKMVFNDEDYEPENNKDESKKEPALELEPEPKQELEQEDESDSESEDEFKVPEEQDWNMDDI